MTDKQKYRLTFRCDCGYSFKKITTNKDLESASCPKCKKKESDRRLTLGDGAVSDNDLIELTFKSVENYDCEECHKKNRFFKEREGDQLSHCQYCGSQNVKYIGHAMSGVTSKKSQNMIKAIDATAEMTMKTYGMNDLNMGSTMRPGDTCAPKLPPAQQAAVDGFFNHGANPVLNKVNANAIGARAIAGAYANPNNPVANLHNAKVKPYMPKTVEAPPVVVKRANSVRAYDNMLTTRQ